METPEDTHVDSICSVCAQDIYYADECEFTRDGAVVCVDCVVDMVLVRSVQYVELGELVENVVVPKEEVVSLLHDGETAKFKIPIYRHYDKLRLPTFVELHNDVYRYAAGMTVKF